ncbi:MAG: DUF1223 domain-containing protein [Parvularculaceae bacterium]
MTVSVTILAAACSGVCLLTGVAAADVSAASVKPATVEIAAARPVVVEMFLSQACKASPTAAKLLQDMSRRRDVVALAWHVDYWDHHPAPRVGAWADPFASPAFTQRQQAYNSRIRRTPMVFTPQAVIDGVISATGSKRDAIEARIVEAQFIDELARPTPPVLNLEPEAAPGIGAGIIRVQVDGVGAPYDAYVVSFRPAAVTKVTAGDNAGLIFDEVNIVTGVEMIASDETGAANLSFDAPKAGLDCAVLVQERAQGRIVAARYCSTRDGE